MISKEMIKKISVFFPVYNEEKNLARTVSRALEVLKKNFEEWEVIIVDDGSKDRSLAIAQSLADEENRIRVIEHPVNRGYGAAFKSGASAAKFDWIVFTDSDGQFDFSEIVSFLRVQEETQADLVVGFYKERRVPLYRKINTFLWETVVRLLFGLRVKDIDCGFKLFARKVLVEIDPLESERGAFISTEFLVKAKKKVFKIEEVGVHHFPRQAGKGTGANLDVIVRSFLDLFRLWKKLR